MYTLDRFCEPLYQSDPVGMISSIPGLINAIKTIHSISRYYNTSERMTSVFYQITNRTIASCKDCTSTAAATCGSGTAPNLSCV